MDFFRRAGGNRQQMIGKYTIFQCIFIFFRSFQMKYNILSTFSSVLAMGKFSFICFLIPFIQIPERHFPKFIRYVVPHGTSGLFLAKPHCFFQNCSVRWLAFFDQVFRNPTPIGCIFIKLRMRQIIYRFFFIIGKGHKFMTPALPMFSHHPVSDSIFYRLSIISASSDKLSAS